MTSEERKLAAIVGLLDSLRKSKQNSIKETKKQSGSFQKLQWPKKHHES